MESHLTLVPLGASGLHGGMGTHEILLGRGLGILQARHGSLPWSEDPLESAFPCPGAARCSLQPRTPSLEILMLPLATC